MSDWWDGQLDSLQTSAEIFYHLTSAEEGGNKNLSVYQEFRASRLQLRFAQDLVTCIQIFISKEKELYERDRTATVRHGHLGNHLSDHTAVSVYSLAICIIQVSTE
ncbi:TPA: hypothetical protein ACH3X2_001713 [Trebouxia sp. C0005]